MNRAELRQMVKDRTGYPGNGPTETARLNREIQAGFLQVTKDLPSALERVEMRLKTQAEVTSTGWYNPAADAYLLKLDNTNADLFANDGTWDARWVDVLKADGTHVICRIRKLQYIIPLAAAAFWILVIDKPWPTLGETGLVIRLFCDRIALPADAQRVYSVIFSPDLTPRTPMCIAKHNELKQIRHNQAFNRSYRPNFVAPGDTYHLRAPHDTPTISTIQEPTNAQKWGYDSGGIERGSAYNGQRYGAAGTFQYWYCLVWGRQVIPERAHGGSQDGVRAGGQAIRMPYHISPPCLASASATATWGGSYLQITSANQSYVEGYNNDPNLESYNRSGLEKWWFRARTATENPATGSNHADQKYIEADSIPYLWRITPASETTTIDRGDSDPVDRSFPLTHFAGTRFLEIECSPSVAEDVLIELDRRPEMIQFDSDVLPLDPRCHDLIIAWMKMAMLGDRDSSLERISFFDRQYNEKLIEMRRELNHSASPQRFGFAHGRDPSNQLPWGPLDFRYGP